MELEWKSISSSFHTDLISEILSRLPQKSIVRFRCVSKLWLSITTYPYFISLFETRNPRLLLCFKEDDELVVSSISQHTLTLDPKSGKSFSYSPYRLKFPKFWNYLSPTASVHGLICFRTPTMAIVWNPSTRMFLTLPKPDKILSKITVFLLGYDGVEGKHKVIALPFCKHNACQVITLGSVQESSWRTVKTNQDHRTNVFNAYGQCIKSFIYYLASTDEMNLYAWVIMRFDVRSEKLDVIQLPSNTQVDMLITYEGRLACVHEEENGISLLILEDAEENKWSTKDFLAPFTYHDESSHIHFQLNGFTHAGEFVYKPYHFYAYHKSWYVLFFDPVRNSFRRFDFKGIADEEGQYPLHMFLNHIETQMSL